MTDNRKRGKFTTKNMVLVAVFAGVSLVLMLLEFPLPFAPAFLKFDLADLPATLATFMLGPVHGIMVCVVKLLLKLIVKGTETAFVGEFANLMASAMYILPAALIYRFKKGKVGAAIALGSATVIVSIGACIMNMFIMFPVYSSLYGIPMDAIIGMGTAINSSVNDLFTLIIFTVLPFNLFKYTIVSIITFFMYKKLKHVFFKDKAKQ